MEIRIGNIAGEIIYIPCPEAEKALSALEELDPNLFAGAIKIIKGAFEAILLGLAGVRNTGEALLAFEAVSDAMRPFVLQTLLRVMELERELEKASSATVPHGIAESLRDMNLNPES